MQNSPTANSTIKQMPWPILSMTGKQTFNPATLKGSTQYVLYFYPKDDTPGCTTEGIDFRDQYTHFIAANYQIYGVSRDSLASHEKFKVKHQLPFDLVSDPDEQLCNAFGVMKLKNMYGKQVRGIERSTFIIDKTGAVIREWRGVKVAEHIAAILAYIKSLPSVAH